MCCGALHAACNWLCPPAVAYIKTSYQTAFFLLSSPNISSFTSSDFTSEQSRKQLMKTATLTTLLFASVAPLCLAHPHKRTAEEVVALKHATRSLKQCSSSLSKRGHNTAGVERRKAMADRIRKERGLKSDKRYIRRDIDTVLGTSHKSDLTGFTQYVSPSYLFGLNSSCALEAGDVTEGPYFVAGEYFRSNLREDQEGVPIWLDIEVVDVATCEPVKENFVEIWATNATGVYAGVTANSNGDGSAANLNTTHGRGVQKTSDDGAVQFETLFPGHYTGRTQHIHVAVLANNTVVLNNGTVYQNVATHVGQMFFDTDLAEQVEATAPYSTNTMTVTSNSEDSILEQQASTIDPVLEYVLLGDSVSDGLLMWTRLGVDLTNSVTMNIAAYHYAEGGVENANSMSGGGGAGGQGGNGTMGGGDGPGGNSTSGGAPPSGSGGMSAGGSPPSGSAGGSATAGVGVYGNSLGTATGIAATSTWAAASPAYTCLCSS